MDPGNARFNTRNVPKVVGGIDEESTALASSLYGAAIERIVPVSSPRVAEMVKLLENTFRAVNIGLANEIALMCAAWASTSGKSSMWRPPSRSASCRSIPAPASRTLHPDRSVLSVVEGEAERIRSRFIELAGQVNSAMPHFVVQKIADALNERRKPVNGSTVLVLGIAYKRDIDDIRESPSLDVMTVLKEKGARVRYSDPHVPVLRADRWHGAVDLHSEPLTAAALAQAACVVVLTHHRLIDCDLVRPSPSVSVHETRSRAVIRTSSARRVAPIRAVAVPLDADDESER